MAGVEVQDCLKAILWDVDGTLAETERDGHLIAFNAAFEELSVPWRWSEQRYGELLRIAGGFERLLYDMQSQPLAPGDSDGRLELATRIHRRKNSIYAARVASGAIALRPGVPELMDDCEAAGVRMAIVTTTSRGNVDALLGKLLGPQWQRSFAAVVCAEDAPEKKPNPQAYRVALERLGLGPAEVVAIEDSPAGLEAARAVGVAVVISRSWFFASDAMPGALAVGPNLGTTAGWSAAIKDGASRIGLAVIRRWHQAATALQLRE
jgi:beta-phosphoglucomutase-like phosphatase (HAD superfamily)